MNVIDIMNPPEAIWIGRKGENVFREVPIDCSGYIEKHPNATITAMYQSGENEPFPVVLEQNGNTFTWKPRSEEITDEYGRIEIVLTDGEAVGASKIVECFVDESLIDGTEHPAESAPAWSVEMVQDVTEQADRAEAAVTHYPQIRNDYWWVWDAESGKWVNTGVKATGEGGGSTIYVTPEQFGAVGDGVADDTAAVRQAMQNPAVALQKTYKVTEAITCAAQLVQGIDGGGIVSSAGGLVFANDTRLVDFFASLPHGYDGSVVEAKGSVYADGLTVTGGKVGILASGQYKAVEIRNCRISDQWGESSRGIYVPFAGETLIEGNTVDTVTNDTTVNADGISVWQSKEETHPTAVIRGNTVHNCRGRFIKASTRDALIEANYCSNDSDVAVIPYFVGIDVQNGCSIVRGNTVIAPSGINVSLRDTSGLHSVHAIEYNKLVYNGVSASNKTMIATTDYANGNATSQVSIVGNDISAQADTSATIQLAYVPSAKYNVYNNRVRGGTWYAMQMKGTFDATTRLEVIGNTNAEYAYFARFVVGMPNVKGDRTVRCETALDFASVLRDTSFTANTTAIDGFTNTAFVRGRDGATGYWIEIWDGTEVGGYKTNGQQIFYHKQGDKHVNTVNGLYGDVTLDIPTVPDMATDPDMTDWDTGKIVDAAVLKSGFTLVGNVLSRKANVSDIPTEVLRYVAQTLTEAEKAQARQNIGAASIADLGTVFTLKGGVATVNDLPQTGNSIGDVWYVENVSAGFIWITSTAYPDGYWEELGETIDLSAYAEKTWVEGKGYQTAQDVQTAISGVRQLPAVAASDNGKFLRVVNGAWAAETVPAAESNSFGGA